jgi:hypothetical protein
MKARSAAKPGGVSAQCEPTLVCEGYSFAVYKVPTNGPKTVDPGALIRRFTCCFQPLLEQLAGLPAAASSPKDLQDWLHDLIATAREFLIAEGLYDCDLAARLAEVGVPVPSADRQAFLSSWNASTLAALGILAAVLQKCLCAALLPPCPPAEMNDCVPIATLTVARGDCRVRQICNIGSRRFLLTWPAIQYWLSWLPWFSSWQSNQAGRGTPTLRTLIDAICCTPIARKFDFTDTRAADLQAQPAPGAPSPAAPVQPSHLAAMGHVVGGMASAPHPFTQVLAESLTGAREANAATLLLAAMGARAPDGSVFASETALQYPGEAMLIHQVVGPALAPVMPLVAGGVARRPEVEALTNEVGRLASTVAELQARVISQQEDIDRLRRRR